MRHVYADYAAQAPLRPEARRALSEALGAYGNPSSIHAFGRSGRRALEGARERAAAVLGVSPEEIIFTSSGSEANALAVLGATRAWALAQGVGHLVISSVEHKSVLGAAHHCARDGWRVTEVPVTSTGFVDPSAVRAAIQTDTAFVSIMYCQNELGTLEPIREIAAALAAGKRGGSPLFHSDACQAPYADLSPRALGLDLMTLNSTKVGGPAGIGLLYIKNEVRLQPIVPGEQERGLRGGTENPALALSFVTALEIAVREHTTERERLNALTTRLATLLQARIPGLRINGHAKERTPHILHVTVPDIEGEAMLLMLDDVGVAVSTGSACSATDLRPSHVLAAIGQAPELMHGSVRFSFGYDSTEADIEYIAEMFPPIVATLRARSVLTTHKTLV